MIDAASRELSRRVPSPRVAHSDGALRVLLISPLPRIDTACGDVTYTETLLAHPPEGVHYETYADAIDRGALREHGVRKSLKQAWRERRGRARESLLTGVTYGLRQVRGRCRRHIFWEPYRFFSVRPGEYDLVHMHVFSARFLCLPCPLVVSAGSPQADVYRDARGWSMKKVRAMEWVEMKLGRLYGVNLNSYRLPQATRVLAWTEYLREWYVSRGVMPFGCVDVIPSCLPPPPATKPARQPRRVGFVAKLFEHKGGRTLLAAFERVRIVRPDAELVIVGCNAELGEAEQRARGIQWIPYIDRQRLLDELVPSFDVFAYPTNYDCISYVTLEAMSRGVPVATSDYHSMPEVVDHGRAGLISKVGDVAGLAANILRLLDPAENARFSRAAVEHFGRTFSTDAVMPQIRSCYDAALAAVTSRHTPAGTNG